jgi:hypothetical protein
LAAYNRADAVALHVTSIWGDRRYLDLSKEITRKVG